VGKESSSAAQSLATSAARGSSPTLASSVSRGSSPSTSGTLLKPTVLDTIIQSSTVEILRFYDIAVAPRGRREVVGFVPKADAVGVIAFEGPNIKGNMTLAIPVAVGTDPTPRIPPDTTHEEWTFELTSQVMGRIKSRLIQFQLRLKTHLPSMLSGEALERYKRRTVREVVYSFTALRGEITLTVDASLTLAVLEYSNAPLVVGDSEVIVFD
jgi:hypothetical protein